MSYSKVFNDSFDFDQTFDDIHFEDMLNMLDDLNDGHDTSVSSQFGTRINEPSEEVPENDIFESVLDMEEEYGVASGSINHNNTLSDILKYLETDTSKETIVVNEESNEDCVRSGKPLEYFKNSHLVESSAPDTQYKLHGKRIGWEQSHENPLEGEIRRKEQDDSEKPLQCRVCEKEFKQKSSLKLHIRWFQNSENPYCKTCSESTKTL